MEKNNKNHKECENTKGWIPDKHNKPIKTLNDSEEYHKCHLCGYEYILNEEDTEFVCADCDFVWISNLLLKWYYSKSYPKQSFEDFKSSYLKIRDLYKNKGIMLDKIIAGGSLNKPIKNILSRKQMKTLNCSEWLPEFLIDLKEGG